MIGFRTDGDLKASGWIHLILLVPKKAICDAFYNKFATRPPFTCNPRLTYPILPTLMTLTLTPHYFRKYLYHHLLTVGSVDLKMDIF